MVEKWLLEVESAMIMSIRDVIRQSVNAYAETPRRQWVIEWPGQVAICVSCIYWTTEVNEAISLPRGLQVSSTHQPIATVAFSSHSNAWDAFNPYRTTTGRTGPLGCPAISDMDRIQGQSSSARWLSSGTTTWSRLHSGQ